MLSKRWSETRRQMSPRGLGLLPVEPKDGRVIRSRIPSTKDVDGRASGFVSGAFAVFRNLVMLRSSAAAVLISGSSSPSQILYVLQRDSNICGGVLPSTKTLAAVL
jgi:hypothetical protein